MQNKLKKLTAFTLMELLVVIVIVGILVAMAFPVYNTVLNKARSTDASSMINQIRVALTAYQNDYGDWPPAILTNTNANGDAYLIGSTNASPATNFVWTDLYHTLTAWPGNTNFLSSNNSRRIVYMQIAAKYLNTPSAPTNASTFFDPWQREYNLAVDANGDNMIGNLPQTTAGSAGPNTNLTINASLAIWSYGSAPTNAASYIVNWK